MRDLRPISFAAQLKRMVREMRDHGQCYDLPKRAWHLPEKGPHDLRSNMHGIVCGTPVGPAAGPHTQMAQNIVLSYVCGARIFELKTIQIMDRLKIPRPCIDVRNIGYNVEWSQELRIEESIKEYAIAAWLINIIRGENLLGCENPIPAAEDPLIYDISVGYDLAGIKSQRVTGFLKAMMDATQVLDELEHELPAEFAAYKKYRPNPKLSSTTTLSTFHGCPKDEIEKIVRYMLEEMGLHTIVKMNPVMLGYEPLEELLRGKLGYAHLRTNPHAYEVGLQFSESIDMMKRMAAIGRERGLGVGAKFSNTLEVLNDEGVLPKSEKVMYLSGAPLHVITSTLAAKWREAMDWLEPLSFSAGVDMTNFPDLVACGCTPITTCTDLLKPGGYGRMSAYLVELKKKMQECGATTVSSFIRGEGTGLKAVAYEFAARGITLGEDQAAAVGRNLAKYDGASPRVAMTPAAPDKSIYEAIAAGDVSNPAAAIVARRVVRRAAAINWTNYALQLQSDDRYSHARNNREPKKIKSHLALYDCINCDKCIPACPNDAMFAYEMKPEKSPRHAITFKPGAGFSVARHADDFEVKKDHQLANFADWCNECSNCMTYCPELGGPFIEKPRIFSDRHGFFATRDDGFCIEDLDGRWFTLARIDGREYEMEMWRSTNRATLRDEYIIAEFDTTTHAVKETFLSQVLGEERTLDSQVYHVIRTVTEGVMTSAVTNPVNA